MRRLSAAGYCILMTIWLSGAGCGGEEEQTTQLPDGVLRDLAGQLFGTPGSNPSGSGSGSLLGLPGSIPGGGAHDGALPKDFPELTDAGGMGQGEKMANWGGDPTKDRNGNRAALKHTPVILIHGNGASAYGNPIWGFMWNLKWDDVVKELKAKGYNDSEIWAVSYLGRAPVMAQLQNPYTSNVDDVRNFIEAVREYLGVQKVDLLTHSLGVQIAKGYMTGLQRDGKWDHSKNHLDAVGTLVSLAGANYGFGNQYDMYAAIIGELLTGHPFEKQSHQYKGIFDDTPLGPSQASQKAGGTAFDPATWQPKDYSGQTALDGGQINYVAIWHEEDQVDKYHDKTGRLWGANLNHGVKGLDQDAMQAHIKLMHDPNIFKLYAPYLNKVGVVWSKNAPNQPNQPSGWTCKETTSSTYAHVLQGRATLCNGFNACAQGSSEDLGLISGLSKVTLAETKSGYFQKGACPP